MSIVCKFGGSSLADETQLAKVVAIIKANPERDKVVVSAPGKRHKDDIKVTDLLEQWYRMHHANLSTEEVEDTIQTRYRTLFPEAALNLMDEIDEIQDALKDGASLDFMMSRGEYLMAKFMAQRLDFKFVDATDLILFHGPAGADSFVRKWKLEKEPMVVPGFYGVVGNGDIRTFPRSGSDITGALIAAAIGEGCIYENWTDVPGVLNADPRIIPGARPIPILSYREMRELGAAGAEVLHQQATVPVRKAGIPIHIRNTNDPDAPGTFIVPEVDQHPAAGTITGIASRGEFSAIRVEKYLLDDIIGFMSAVTGVVAAHGISLAHAPTGTDTLNVVVPTNQLEGKREKLEKELIARNLASKVVFSDGISLVRIVGHGMKDCTGVLNKATTAISEANVNVKLISQDMEQLSITLGVADTDREISVKALYAAFFS